MDQDKTQSPVTKANKKPRNALYGWLALILVASVWYFIGSNAILIAILALILWLVLS